jgi:probable rRNA maturation factor
MQDIRFHEQKPVPWFRERNRMRALLTDLFRKEKTRVDSIQFIFMSDADLLDLNQRYLKHDFYTDIITFDLSDTPASPRKADIFISVDRVADNAKTWSTAKAEELRRVMIHGCLHLCGYKDKLKTEKAEMRAREDHYLQRYSKCST